MGRKQFYASKGIFTWERTCIPATIKLSQGQSGILECLPYAHPVARAALYSAQLVRDISFSRDLYVGEDTLYFAKALKKAGGFIFVDEQYYYYRIRTGSIMNDHYQMSHATEITSWERIIELFSDQSESFRNECECAIALSCKKNYLNAKKSNYKDINLYREMYNKARQRYRNILCSPEIEAKRKISFIVFLLLPNTYVLLVGWRKKALKMNLKRIRQQVKR